MTSGIAIRTQLLDQCGWARPLAGRLLLIILTVWALVMIVPSVAQVFWPLGAFGLSADNDGVLIDVTAPFDQADDSPAARAGLAPGDRIDLRQTRCMPPAASGCASLVPILGGLGGLQYSLPGREIALPILPADGRAPRLVHLRAAPAPLHWPVRVVLLADTIVGMLFVLTAFRLAWMRPSPMTWGFFLYAAWFNPGQAYAFYAILQTWPVATLVEALAEAVLRGAGYAGLIAFALRFPADIVEARWRALDRGLPVIAAVLSLMMLASYANLFGVGTEALARATFLSGFVVDGLVVLILLERRSRLPPQDEQRMRWVIAGATIGLPAFMVAALWQSSGLLQSTLAAAPSQIVIGLLYLLNGVLAYFVGVAVQHRRVVSVSIPLRHGTIVALLTLALGVPVFWLHEILGHYQDHLHLPEWIWPLVIGPVMLIVLQRLHEISVDLMDHVFNRRFHQARHHLREAGRRMLAARSFGEIDCLLAQEPVRGLRLTSGAVFRRIDGTYRRMDGAIGWAGSEVQALRPGLDGGALSSIDAAVPVRLPRGVWEERGFSEPEQAPCLAVPVCGGAREAVAVALFGPHETGSDINPDEYHMLHDLASRAAAAYDRVETEALRREVQELRARLRV